MSLKILFAASECAPLIKVGGLADVVGGLPKALIKLGFDVRVIIPYYRGILDIKKYPAEKIKGGVFQSYLPDTKIPIYLLDLPEYFNTENIYGKNSIRFFEFSKKILRTLPINNFRPSIIHCHDNHTAGVCYLIGQNNLDYKTILTIHNPAFHGRLKLNNQNTSLLKEGIRAADKINTVSPTFAKEVLREGFGVGKELRARKKDFSGILNGIDYERYPAQGLEIKINNKIKLRKKLNLKTNEKQMLVGFIGRLYEQKGIDLLIKVIPKLMRLDLQLVILGTGQEEYEKTLQNLAKKYPEKISARIKFDSLLAREIYQGADALLMPSRFEPCGLNQMIAMRYGTVPIVRKTGGLADTVREGKTGFLFTRYDPSAFYAACLRAYKTFRGDRWHRLQNNGMKQDFSWMQSAKKYAKLYNDIAQ